MNKCPSSALSPKRQRFVEEFCVDFNATQAAIRAGYSPHSANVNGPRLLVNARIQQAVAVQQKKMAEKTELTAERVLGQMERRAFSDIRKAFDENGNLRPINEWPDELAAAVDGVKVVTRSAGKDEDGKIVVEYVHEIKMARKDTSLQMLAQNKGLLKTLLEVTGASGGPVRLDAAKAMTVEELRAKLQALTEAKAKLKAKG